MMVGDATTAAGRRAMLPELVETAERAGEVILAIYAKRDNPKSLGVKRKDDASPVTLADEEAEAVILPALSRLTPDLTIVSEEDSAKEGLPSRIGRRFWLVDPLDGTREFLTGNGEFTVNIALIEDGFPIAGVVHAPALGKTWVAADGVAELRHQDGTRQSLAARAIPPEGATIIASRRHGSGAQLDGFLANYSVADRITAGSSLKFCLLAEARADIYPRFGRTMEWDTAAAHAVLAAAGGRVETEAGTPLAYGKPGFENPFFVAYGVA